jgi:hypothetical protein
MPRQLTFKLNNKEFLLEPVKLDRKKLYGWVDKEMHDGEGNLCSPAILDDTSMKIIPGGDIAQAILTEEGEWVSRSELSAVDSEGNPVDLVPSSFDGTIELKDTVTLEEYLDHVIKNVYTFTGDDENEMVKLLENGTIYTFLFNYRADYEGTPGFLIENDGEIFLTIGNKINIDYMSQEDISKQLFEKEDDEVEDEESEGLVIRSSGNFIYKLKPKHSLDAVILGYVEGVRETKGMVTCFAEPVNFIS